MQPLLSEWTEVALLLKEYTLMLFLDYDGTLTPIVENPQNAKLSLSKKRQLQNLTRTDGIKIAIISGRSLKDLKRRVGIKGIIYAGNHGFEFEERKSHFIHPGILSWKNRLRKLNSQLKKALKPFPGILVEDKVLTLSIHYRKLSAQKADQAKAAFLEILQSDPYFSQFVLTEGKKVWEVRPPTLWNKGRMILWLLGRFTAHAETDVFPIYVGDDQTDEDAFKALKGKGLGIKVTADRNEPSDATYYLDSTAEVFDFLRNLKTLKGEKNNSDANH